jgi:hypothetical protein
MAFLGQSLVILADGGYVLPYPGLVKPKKGHLASFPELKDHLTAELGPIGAYFPRSELSASPKEALDPSPTARWWNYSKMSRYQNAEGWKRFRLSILEAMAVGVQRDAGATFRLREEAGNEIPMGRSGE